MFLNVLIAAADADSCPVAASQAAAICAHDRQPSGLYSEGQIKPRRAPSTGEGAVPGQSDLLIRWAQSKRVRWNVFLDDSGSQATGKLQAGVTASLDNPLHLNDLFYLSVSHTAESFYL